MFFTPAKVEIIIKIIRGKINSLLQIVEGGSQVFIYQ